jgi:copper chaperone CopZ
VAVESGQGGWKMDKVVFDVPSLWADHHVLKLREALGKLEGVEDVYASSAWKQVMVAYDPTEVDDAAIQEALAEAGYPVGEGGVPVLVEPTEIRRDPQWETLGVRLAATSEVDREMAGEFRRY